MRTSGNCVCDFLDEPEVACMESIIDPELVYMLCCGICIEGVRGVEVIQG